MYDLHQIKLNQKTGFISVQD